MCKPTQMIYLRSYLIGLYLNFMIFTSQRFPSAVVSFKPPYPDKGRIYLSKRLWLKLFSCLCYLDFFCLSTIKGKGNVDMVG